MYASIYLYVLKSKLCDNPGYLVCYREVQRVMVVYIVKIHSIASKLPKIPDSFCNLP